MRATALRKQNVMKYPYSIEILKRADAYAKKSLKYTYSYSGWEDETGTSRQYDRILIGRFGQEWVADYCRLNRIKVIFDESDYRVADNFDLIIIDSIVDVKTTMVSTIPCQVNAALAKKDVDFYCFIRLDRNFTFVEPLGFISQDLYFKYAQKINYNECFPKTSIRNKFKNGSYILKRSFLSCFETTIKTLTPLITLKRVSPVPPVSSPREIRREHYVVNNSLLPISRGEPREISNKDDTKETLLPISRGEPTPEAGLWSIEAFTRPTDKHMC